MSIIEYAISEMGGVTAFAEAVGVSRQAVYAWKKGSAKIDPEHVLMIVRATRGAVTPYQLNPKIYPDPTWMPEIAA